MLTATRTSLLLSGLVLSSLALSPTALSAQPAPVVPQLAGAWKAQELKIPATSDLDREVWGPNASKVRNVQLAIEPDGSGTLRIQSSVVDASGRPKRYSQSVTEARLRVGEPQAGGDRVQPAVTVVSAEERYLDDPKDVRRIEGLRLKLDLMNMESKDLNIFYETAEGNGSFGETLRRPARSGKSASLISTGQRRQPRG